MSRTFLTNIDLSKNQLLNALAQVLASDPGTPVAGQFWFNSTTKVLKFYDGTTTYVLGRLDQLNAPTAAVSMNSQKLTNLATGTASTDAATVGQVSAAAAGLQPKASVRLATTAALPANTYSNGTSGVGATLTATANAALSVDGTAVAVGDRILVKNEVTGANNGVYVVTNAGSAGAAYVLTRATDFDGSTVDTQSTIQSGAYMFVDAGSTLAQTGWILSTVGPFTVGTTSLTFVKFTATASGVTKFAATVGDGTSTSLTVTHNLGSTDVIVQCYNVSGGAMVEPDITAATVNTVTLGFTIAPAASSIRAVVMA